MRTAIPVLGVWSKAKLALTVSLILMAGLMRVNATELQCIEESKYKYLYQLFDGDMRRFADYFGLDPDVRRLPDPEFCRAALLSGPTGEPSKDEFGDLIRIIVRNRGWLAAIHLASPGGSGSPFPMAYVIRKLRMKTVVARNAGNRIVYDPDFAPVPPLSPAASIPSTAVCFLKNAVSARSRTTNAISGIVRPEPFQPTYEINIDMPGSDIRSLALPRPDARLCQQRCNDEPRCRAWTFNGPPRVDRPVCWLKSVVPPRRQDGNGTVSGMTRPDPFKATFEPGFDFRGNDFSRIDLPRPDPRLCQQRCQGDDRCRAWAYNGPGLNVLPTGWDQYRKVQISLPAVASPLSEECASSCSFIHAGGADRSGVVKVHRPSAAQDMADFEVRQAAGEVVRKFYRYMDAGAELIQIWESTPSNTVRPAVAPRFPRYLNDYLLNSCARDAEILQRQEGELATADKRVGAPVWAVHEQRRAVEQCVAREFELARLAAYDKMCGNGCDPKKVREEIESEIKRTLDQY